MELVVNQFMETNSKMKISKYHLKDLVNLLWLTQDQIPMDLNFSLLQLNVIGLLENMLFLEKLLKEWTLLKKWNHVVLAQVKPKKPLLLLIVVNFKTLKNGILKLNV